MEVYGVVQERTWAIRRLGEDYQQLNTVIAGRNQRNLSGDALTNLRRIITSFTESSYPGIVYYDFAEPGVLERAMGLCANTNMAAPDCIHVQLALEIRVDLFVTSDSQVVREADDWVPTANPVSAIDRLAEMGFHIATDDQQRAAQ